MPNRSSNQPREDVNEIAARILSQATKETSDDLLASEETRRLAAKILGRRGGLKGGPARAKKLSKKRRQEIAKKAAETRWAKDKK